MDPRSVIWIILLCIGLVVLVFVAVKIIDRTIPAEFSMIAKVLVGLLALVVIVYQLMRMSGI